MFTLTFAKNRRNRNSLNITQRGTTAMIARFVIAVVFALTAVLSTFGTAAAQTTIPSNFRALGPVQEWKSRTVEFNRPGPQAHSFELPRGTAMISATVVWRGTNNNGQDNENGVVTTSAPEPYTSFLCNDRGHGSFVCATFIVSYTAQTFDVAVAYNLDRIVDSRHGDSHKYTILI
jgi:hypothetical protein